MEKQIGFLMLLSILTTLACSSGEEESKIKLFPEFRPFVQAFEEEAGKRGISFDFEESGLEILLGPTGVDNAAGVCRGDGTIEIQNSIWDSYSTSAKEQLIFHELGHCVLGRPHRNVVLKNGEWGSIMRGTPIPDDRGVVINYSGSRKQYYIDELFDESAPFPDWEHITRDYDEDTVQDSVFYLEETDSLGIRKFIDVGRDFQIEFNLQNNGLARVGVSWGGADIVNSNYILINKERSFQYSNGFENDGLVLNFKQLDALNPISNRLTIRKVDDFYYFFANEIFIYWADFERFNGSEMSSFAINAAGRLEPNYDHLITDFRVHYLE